MIEFKNSMPYLISLTLGILGGIIFIFFPLTSLLFISFPGIFYLTKKKLFPALLCLIIAFLGLLSSLSTYENSPSDTEKVTRFKGYLISSKQELHVFKTIDGNNVKVYSKVQPEEKKLYSIECKPIEEHKNPYVYSKDNFCYALQMIEEGTLNLSIFKLAQEKINRELKAKLNENTSAVMIAMTTGHRHEISKQIREDFQRTGLIHLLSISGAHFSLLFTVFFLIFKTLIRFIPYKWLIRLTLYIKPSQLSIILCFPILLFYYLLIESNYPSTRAFIMAIFFMLGVLTERKSLWIITLSFACLIILIIDPSSAKDLSFQLSFLATIAIGITTDIYKGFKDRIKNKLLSYLVLSLMISFAASIITAPLVIYKFHYLSLISPVANLTAGILIGMLLFPLNVIFVFIYLITGIYPFPEIVNSLAGVCFWLMHLLGSLSFSSLSLPAIPLGSLLIIYVAIFFIIFSFYGLNGIGRKISVAISTMLILTAVLISFILIHSDRNSFKVTFLNVGQADSAVIETPNQVFLVDTGKTGFEAEGYLKAKGYKNIQALIITHEQKDHAGGFLRIIENFVVREVWDNGFIEYNINEPLKIRHLQRGDILKSGNCIFTILHPYKGFYASSIMRDSNELGLVFSLKCREKFFLFTSDAGKEALASIPINYLNADIVKIPHHGSKNSFFEEFYQALSPQVCIISVGKNNPYGHPNQNLLEYLREKCTIYRTDVDGAIQIREKENGEIEIKTFEGNKLKPYSEWENLKKLFILW